MNIGLIDVDSRNFPNLPLMKLSAWHKREGDHVGWYTPFNKYDIVYKSKVFSDSTDYQLPIYADKVIKGGTGYAIHGAGGETYRRDDDKPLADEVEHIYPDYSLYNIKDTAYGFLTRGCPRGCDFCIVAKKEGKCSRKVANLDEFWNGQKNIILCDPNILACKDREELLHQLEKTGAWIDFNQGLDARMINTDKIAKQIAEIKTKEIHFAWDKYKDGEKVLRGLELFARHSTKPKGHNAIVYVLVNHGTTIEQDLERIYRLRDLGYWGYVMIYDKAHANKIYIRMQRWCNNRFIFANCRKFEDYGKTDKKDTQQLDMFK